MNDTIIKPGLVRNMVEKLRDTKIEIGGNKESYKKKYHLKYTQEIVSNVLDAFLETLEDAVAEGDTVRLKGYMTIKSSYVKERRRRNVYNNEEFIDPAHYQAKISLGAKLKEANKRYNEKVSDSNEE